jgi:hypothetical protein
MAMYQQNWEEEFKEHLFNELGLTPEQINFRWKLFAKQGFAPDKAIAHLVESDRMCPELGIFPVDDVMEDLIVEMGTEGLMAIAKELQKLVEVLAPSQQLLGFGEAPRSEVYIFCNRSNNGLWYSLTGEGKPVSIDATALTGYIRKVEFKTGERRGKQSVKLHCHVEADKKYILETSSDTHFSKGLLSAIASLDPEQLRQVISIVPQASTQNGEVLFCNLYLADGQQVFAPYDDKTDFRATSRTAIDNIRLANGEAITEARAVA